VHLNSTLEPAFGIFGNSTMVTSVEDWPWMKEDGIITVNLADVLYVLSHFPPYFTHTFFTSGRKTRADSGTVHTTTGWVLVETCFGQSSEIWTKITIPCWCKQDDMITDIKCNLLLTWRLIWILWKTKMKKTNKQKRSITFISYDIIVIEKWKWRAS